ncbi:DUF3885 domain-containing protein [Leptothoe kymatousa]|uniref:DUF3885 domain-containing protein n=1 Tax=Leptothoe kymatousa TAU-MAC 1615 TaxID=2364775 RepID=A0ABS5Y6M6_9CYAN|nr:DUF3885 domain-containing protein [Leptothoe kymatousa]MBT9313473.1 DUF3885 domain-containing protein [Leptothoe kymatousa TAU-MAC 1615]
MDIKLEMPLFYRCPFGLRLEIGPATLGVWKDRDNFIYNEDYFDIARQRAVAIFESAFVPTDRISMVLQIYAYGRQKIHRSNYLFRQIKAVDAKVIKYSTRGDLYVEDRTNNRERWRRVTISQLQTRDIAYENLLHAMVNQDFSNRTPSLSGQLFFLNHDKQIVLNLYDDRGMDVVSLTRQPLEPLYQRHNTWILDRNREQIENRFNE